MRRRMGSQRLKLQKRAGEAQDVDAFLALLMQMKRMMSLIEAPL